MTKAKVASFSDHVTNHWTKSEHMAFIEANHITSYEDVYALIKNEAASPESRIAACQFLGAAQPLAGYSPKPRPPFDRRRIVSALLTALKSSNDRLMGAALFQLSIWGTKTAVPPLLQIVTDRTRDEETRRRAIYALGSMRDQRAAQPLAMIADDQTEVVSVRSEAIERLDFVRAQDEWYIDKCVQWLADDTPDIRFWAAWGLVCHRESPHMTTAIADLDHVVARDHVLSAWLWHVDREAVAALEGACCYALMRDLNLLNDDNMHSVGTYLVSASLEFTDFLQAYREKTPPPIDLRIDPAEFAKQLQSRWKNIKLNVRADQLTCYLLDWQLVNGEDVLIGGLLRDQYTIVLTSNHLTSVVEEFAHWVRSVIPDQHTLYLYEWAGGAETL